jgi:hypothetical protein
MIEQKPQLPQDYLLWMVALVGLGLGLAFILPLLFPQQSRKPTALHTPIGRREERTLDVIFQWNAHSFEAHEVLGVPKGCKIEEARAAYWARVKRDNAGDPEPFLAAALHALETRTRGH